GKITAQQAIAARDKPIQLNVAHDLSSVAPYFVEELRRYLETTYGSDQVHQGGLRVYTSLDGDLQRTANQVVLDGLAAYERRHGWKGHLQNVLSDSTTLENYHHPDWDDELEINGYVHALVIATSPGTATVKFGHYTALLGKLEVVWTLKKPSDILKPGDLVY